MNRAVICSLYHAIGRAVEVGLLSWDLLEFNTSHLGPAAMWQDTKNGKTIPCVFFVDAITYLVDWLHSVFCYLMSDGSNSYSFLSNDIPDGKRFLFPTLYTKKEPQIAADVTEMLRDLVDKGTVRGLTKKHTSHGLKKGAADECAKNFNMNIICTVCRAGWDYSGEVSATVICSFSTVLHTKRY